MNAEAGVHLKGKDWDSRLSQVPKLFLKKWCYSEVKVDWMSGNPRTKLCHPIIYFPLFCCFLQTFHSSSWFFLSLWASVVLKWKRLRGMCGGLSLREKPTRRVKWEKQVKQRKKSVIRVASHVPFYLTVWCNDRLAANAALMISDSMSLLSFAVCTRQLTHMMRIKKYLWGEMLEWRLKSHGYMVEK